MQYYGWAVAILLRLTTEYENAGPDFGPSIGCAISLSITSGRYVFLSWGFSLGYWQITDKLLLFELPLGSNVYSGDFRNRLETFHALCVKLLLGGFLYEVLNETGETDLAEVRRLATPSPTYWNIRLVFRLCPHLKTIYCGTIKVSGKMLWTISSVRILKYGLKKGVRTECSERGSNMWSAGSTAVCHYFFSSWIMDSLNLKRFLCLSLLSSKITFSGATFQRGNV